LDKYEYKLRLEEIRTLNKKGRFQEAAQVADTVDWNKVRNVSTLCVISDVYKINRRFEDAKAMLLLANDKNPQNRRISYALCDLTIKMGQVVEAVEYYKEFVQQAPNDNNRYILLYKIYEAQDISLEERIAVLKEYKKREYNEKWAYELAFLYHRIGLATECIEECDQLILWFGEGKYVIKAMELKQLYAALSPAQQQSYDRMTGRWVEPAAEPEPEPELENGPEVEELPETELQPEITAEVSAEEEMDIQIKPMDMGEYNTINLQAALAESMREVLEPEVMTQDTVRLPDTGMRQIYAQPTEERRANAAARLAEYGGENAEYLEDVTRVLSGSEELTNGVTGQLEEEETERILQQVTAQKEAETETDTAEAEKVIESENVIETADEEVVPEVVQETAETVLNSGFVQENSGMDNLLAQEYDGQISLALPEERVVEKQITGQMNIEDVLREWERMKEENARRRKNQTREWMLQQTGSLFAEFDQQSRDGILEQLERENAAYEESMRRLAKKPAAEPVKEKAAETMDDSEVEELEEIQEMQDESWTRADSRTETAESMLEEEDAVQMPRPANAAARAAVGVGAAAVGENLKAEDEPEQESAEENVQEAAAVAAETSDIAQNPDFEENPDIAEVVDGAADEEADGSADKQQEETAETETDAEEQIQQEADEQPKEPAKTTESDRTAGLEDTAALHARIREEQIQEHMRHMSREEKDRFAPYVPTRGAMRQLVTALDSISLSAFTGNVILTGAPGSDTMGLARNMIRSVKNSNNNFSGKVAKISGDILNEKSAAEVIAKVGGGALLVENAGKLSAQGAQRLAEALNQEHTGVIVFAMDTKKAMERLADRCKPLADCFTARFDIAALDSATLVKYGCQYAYTQEFSIDEMGRLALHTRIEDMQTSEHAVTVDEVREIIDEAIESASRMSLRHFWDIIARRRYDDDDMIILRERDFI